VCIRRCSDGVTSACRYEDDNCARELAGDSIEESEGSSELDPVVLEMLETSGVCPPPSCETVVSPENKRDNSGPSSFSPVFDRAMEDWI
jgi:hypothetical protein